MESILPSRFRASILDSALDSLRMMKRISSVSTCRDNSWGAAPEDPNEPLGLGASSQSHATDDVFKYDDGIIDSITSEPRELRSSAEYDDGIADSMSRATDNSWGAVQEDSSEPECDDGIADPMSCATDNSWGAAQEDSSEPECDNGIADSIPSEPPELSSRLSRVSRATAEHDDGIADPVPSEPPELRSRLSCVPRAAAECGNGISDSIPSEPPDELRSRLSATLFQNSWGASAQEDSFSPRANAQVRILVW